MSTAAKDRAPAPLDPFGNEVCLLFLKYGKCRYKKKCKLSHVLPDKDAPFMQKVTPTATEQPDVDPGPKIAFSVRKVPYARRLPSPSTYLTKRENRASTLPENEVTRQGSKKKEEQQKTAQQMIGNHDVEMSGQNTDQINLCTSSTANNRTATTNTTLDDSEMAPLTEQKDQQVKMKPKRSAKTRPECLLASLFTTIIQDSAARERYRQPPVNTFEITNSASKAQTSKKAESILRLKVKSRSASKPSAPISQFSATSTAYSTNEAGASSEKVEQWYITNKAHLDTASRRLMVLTKPKTVHQRSQLKTMRKHHWECRTEIEHQLKMNAPAMYSLKIARTRIDWERVAPYITLMIQAAFKMDIEHQHLPVVGTTLCVLLEHKDLSGLVCEELLVSWGLTEIDARRFTDHLWEVMVAAAGEADLRGGKGFGIRVRQYEETKDYRRVQSRLLELNKAPTCKP
ncbi:hypothetical protein BGZ65_009721 [Modicella reniformis]|uniref:C3H1-type domain-containing protein n=1 Tax=Modicella reniformis TaxID=1440133 RepID=A0A9P6IMR1_9FUNG|nr:hypothetical protein BGZ65_009721 [Modicella reniformis]